MDNKQFYTISQVAKMIGISRIAVYKKVKKGQLKAVKKGRIFLIPARELGFFSGEKLTSRQKQVIEQGVNHVIQDYGLVLQMLGKE